MTTKRRQGRLRLNQDGRGGCSESPRGSGCSRGEPDWKGLCLTLAAFLRAESARASDGRVVVTLSVQPDADEAFEAALEDLFGQTWAFARRRLH